MVNLHNRDNLLADPHNRLASGRDALNNMSKSKSYKISKCCGGCDCDFLNDDPVQPCWGQVEMTSVCDDEDGWPLCNHLCQGHRDSYEIWYDKKLSSYYPEPINYIDISNEQG